MNEAIRALEPRAIWNNFADLNAVPRASKKEERVIAFVKAFGEELNLETVVDPVGNVIIRKPATPGMEDRVPIVMQSHLDMVHQKNNDTDFDFETQGIEMLVDGDWVRANGTTLGADNGLGVATIMAILQSDDIPHPELEALFTIDEETGMTGAMELQDDVLKGEILLNLDTEEDNEIGVGCAGGVDVTAKGSYEPVKTAEGDTGRKLVVKGLQGGHSGMDIIKGLGNANKIMNRLMFATRDMIRISGIAGGSLRNAIPRESEAVVVLSEDRSGDFEKRIRENIAAIENEFKSLEPGLKISISSVETPSAAMSQADSIKLINSLQAAHNGVYRMSPDIEGLVEASNNIARVTVGEGKIQIENLTRSSVESSKDDTANSLKAVFELVGYEVMYSGSYPGWAPNMESPILKVMEPLYERMYNSKPEVAACHAGLECGIIGRHYPDMDMISFGPTIKGAHSPDERASISSLQKFWEYVKAILAHIPKRNV